MAKTNHFRISAMLGVTVLGASLLAMAGTSQKAEAAFPGDNGRIAFTSSRITVDNPEGDAEIFTMDPNGANLTQITKNAGPDYGPVWNAAGTKIAFLSGRDNPAGEVYKMEADGDNQTRLTNNSMSEFNPAWSPGGTRIAFTRLRDGNSDIYTMDAVDANNDGNGDNQKRLTRSSAYDAQPSWSPNGKSIAFASDRKGNWEVFKMKPRPEGRRNRPVNLTKNPAYDSRPDWAPDGTRIAFESGRDSIDGEVYVMSAGGDNPTRLTESQGGNWLPSFSPDGTKIAFRSDRDGNGEIYSIDTDPATNDAANLTKDSARDSDPDWQPT